MSRRAFPFLFAVFAAHFAAAADWSDVEGRIQYAWYTEDVRALRGVLASLGDGDGSDALQGYYRGFGEYRVALLSLVRDKEAAGSAAEACIEHLGAANEARKDFADALALQAACQALLASLKVWKAPLLAPRSQSRFDRALKLAPRNPRVLLLEALADSDRERAFARVQQAVAAFEAERQAVAPTPAWGAPGAYAQFARNQLDRGDVVAARGALERGLLLAPDFAAAKRPMAALTTG